MAGFLWRPSSASPSPCPVNFLSKWITTLCLDAPFVALAWQELYAQASDSNIGWHHRILIFLAVWLGYAADRLLDARRHRINKTHRHLFFRQNRTPILFIWAIVLFASLTFAIIRLSSPEFINGVLIAISSAVLTFLVQSLRGPSKPYLKSLTTAALVLVSATLFPLFSGQDVSPRAALALASTFVLFFTNCMAIHRWDRKIDRAQEGDTFLSANRLGYKVYLAALAQLCLAGYLLASDSSYISLPMAGLASLALIYPLDAAGEGLAVETRRLAADAALLTPFAFLLL